MQLDREFVKFYDDIALGELPEERIQRAWNRLQNYLVEHAGVPSSDVFLQGSYANRTAVRPASSDGEYDLDVVSISASASATPNEALKELEGTLREDADYANRITLKKPCVRLEYADDHEGRFHIDVVCARVPEGAALEIPFRDDAWHDTDPAGYTSWCLAKGDRFHRTVRFLKRWRDVNQDDRRCVKSIVLQVMAADYLAGGSDAESITGTFESLQAYLDAYPDGPPEIRNPVLESECLSERWPDEHYTAFRGEISSAARIAREALDEPDAERSYELWARLLGDDFPRPDIRQDVSPPPPPPPGYRTRAQQPPREERYGK